jgi:hypothetical protein
VAFPRPGEAFVSRPGRVGALFASASAGLRARLGQRPHRSAEPQNESDRGCFRLLTCDRRQLAARLRVLLSLSILWKPIRLEEGEF